MVESTPPVGGQGDAPRLSASAAIPEAERRRLQKCFLAGEQKAATNIDYAIEMFTACVVGDPASPLYLQNLLAVLKKKFAGKKGGGFGAIFSAGARGGLKKFAAAGQWQELLKKGIEILRTSPGDHATLLAMAKACGELGFHEVHPIYLRAALDAAPADPEINRACADYLEARGEYDQAIACWRRIGNAKGMGEEAERKITKLQVDKTFAKGLGLEGRQAPKPHPAAGGGAPVVKERPRGEVLRETVASDPTNVDAALELADLLEKEATIDEAEKVLLGALAASGNDLKVREHLEDRQLRWVRHRVHVAESRFEAEATSDNKATLDRLRAAQLKQEIDIYAARTQRYPENMTWRHELALRLKAAGNYTEAIKQFQDLLQDPRRKGGVALELGECFQRIKQYDLAMRNYQAAVDALGDREMELRKRALYRAGVLASARQDIDSAQKYLSELGGLDFGYRDVAERLDKLASGKDKGAS
jgi:tetratricopeptide (TPR) repeat protein